MVKNFIMVNKSSVKSRQAQIYGGNKMGGVKKEFLLNVGFILSGNNGGKPSFSSYFD
jgi:hypothetical protein